MIGAIAGDIIGSAYEGRFSIPKDFPLFTEWATFTDDTVLTVAIASAIRKGEKYRDALLLWGRNYPQAGYGENFTTWLESESWDPYNSYGNGSAMRVSAVGWAFDDMDDVLREAKKSAEVTHNHPDGIKGAQAVAASILLARNGKTKEQILALLTDGFGYDFSADLEQIRAREEFDLTCKGTVTSAALAFLYSTDFESAVRNAVYLGGDTDTLACIAGSIAEAFYNGVPSAIQQETIHRLDEFLLLEVVAFAELYGLNID